MNKKKANKSLKGRNMAIAAGVVILALLAVGYLAFKGVSGSRTDTTSGKDIVIPTGQISEKASFFPYKSGDVKMEVLAVKASDGSIRTAFNTCQVCFDSGRGYYVQEGDVLVCQNCGNRFGVDDIEMVRGGCNPVPILEENKTVSGSDIVIKADFMEQNRQLFLKWGKP